MLIEERYVRQNSGEHCRRWFRDEDFDLIVWNREDGTLHGFQLCYDKQQQEKALTWLSDRGFSHHDIDSGEESPLANRSPILGKLTEKFDADRILKTFQSAADTLSEEIKNLINQKVMEYGQRS